MKKFFTWKLYFIFFICFILGIASGLYNLDRDIINMRIASNIEVMIFQNVLFLILSGQMLKYSSIYSFVVYREQVDLVKKWLCKIVFIEISIFFISFYGSYFIGNSTAFVFGSPIIGSSLLLMRFIMVLLSGIALVSLFRRNRHPYLLTISILIINVIYHYFIEYNFLLPLYTPHHLS